MQAFQSLTRHQLVMDSSMSLTEDSVSEPGVSPSIAALLRRPFPLSARRRSTATPSSVTSSLRRTQSYHEGLSVPPGSPGVIPPLSPALNGAAQRRPSRFDLCGKDARRTFDWTEYTVRRTLVRFRNRKSALRSSLRRLSGQRRVPAQVVKEVFDHEYEVCRWRAASAGERFTAMFICWFYRSAMDLYYHLTDDGTERSFFKWLLATLLVTSGALLFVALVGVALHQLNFLLLLLLNAGVRYVSLLVGFFICILGALAIVNFD